jgi:hypothetical protein
MSAGEIMIVKIILTKSQPSAALSPTPGRPHSDPMNNKLVVVAGGARKLDRLLVAAPEHPHPQIEAEPLVAAVARGSV